MSNKMKLIMENFRSFLREDSTGTISTALSALSGDTGNAFSVKRTASELASEMLEDLNNNKEAQVKQKITRYLDAAGKTVLDGMKADDLAAALQSIASPTPARQKQGNVDIPADQPPPTPARQKQGNVDIPADQPSPLKEDSPESRKQHDADKKRSLEKEIARLLRLKKAGVKYDKKKLEDTKKKLNHLNANPGTSS